MSWPALGWAAEQKPGRVADKMVLIALADRHSTESDLAYPSIAWLADFACLDRKTVVAALARLEEAGLISDSGIRMGKTKQVKAYRLAFNGTEKGVPKTEHLEPKSTAFSAKQSQKRDTEPSLEPSLSNDRDKSRALGKRDCPDGIPPDLWADFLTQRKTKFTPSALKGLLREAAKARWTPEAAFTECVDRGWQSFKAKWVTDNDRKSASNDEPRNPYVRAALGQGSGSGAPF